jgi:hypothetical protein
MLIPSGLLSEFIGSFGYGSITLSSDREITVSFVLNYTLAEFQTSCYNMEIDTKGVGSPYIIFSLKYT